MTYRGIAAFAAEWQFNAIGSYHPALTYLFLLLVFSLPLLLLRLVPGPGGRADAKARQAALADPENRRRHAIGRISRLRATLFGAAALALVVAIVVAAFMLFLPSAGGPTSSVLVGADDSPATGPVALTGRLLYDKTTVFNEDFVVASRSNRFAPMVASGADDTELHYFVELPPEGGPDPRDAVTVRKGILRKGGLPGEVVQLYRYAGFKVDPNYYVLFASGGSMRRAYVTRSLELLVLAAFLAVIGGLFAYRRRRLTRAGPFNVEQDTGA